MKYRNKTKENKTKQNRILRFYQHYYNLKTSLCRGVLWYDCPSKNHDLNFFFLRWIIYHFFFFFFPLSRFGHIVSLELLSTLVLFTCLCARCQLTIPNISSAKCNSGQWNGRKNVCHLPSLLARFTLCNRKYQLNTQWVEKIQFLLFILKQLWHGPWGTTLIIVHVVRKLLTIFQLPSTRAELKLFLTFVFSKKVCCFYTGFENT